MEKFESTKGMVLVVPEDKKRQAFIVKLPEYCDAKSMVKYINKWKTEGVASKTTVEDAIMQEAISRMFLLEELAKNRFYLLSDLTVYATRLT